MHRYTAVIVAFVVQDPWVHVYAGTDENGSISNEEEPIMNVAIIGGLSLTLLSLLYLLLKVKPIGV